VGAWIFRRSFFSFYITGVEVVSPWMRAGHPAAPPRRATISATVALNAVVLMSLTGLCLMFKHVMTDNGNVNLRDPKHTQAARQAVASTAATTASATTSAGTFASATPLQDGDAEARRQQAAAASNAAFLAGKPFNVSLLVDNRSSGGQRGEVVIAVDPRLAPLGAQVRR
jgi:hypothetical protein